MAIVGLLSLVATTCEEQLDDEPPGNDPFFDVEVVDCRVDDATRLPVAVIRVENDTEHAAEFAFEVRYAQFPANADEISLGDVRVEERVPAGRVRRLEVGGQVPATPLGVQCDVSDVTRVRADPDR